MTTYDKEECVLKYNGEHTVSLEIGDTFLEKSFGDPGDAQTLYEKLELHIRKTMAGIRE